MNVDKWQYNDASLTIEGTDIDMMPVSYMVNGTDENGITAQIVDCGTGFAKDYEDKDVEGKIALVGVDQFNESWIGGYIYEAYEHGVKALVTYDWMDMEDLVMMIIKFRMFVQKILCLRQSSQ